MYQREHCITFLNNNCYSSYAARFFIHLITLFILHGWKPLFRPELDALHLFYVFRRIRWNMGSVLHFFCLDFGLGLEGLLPIVEEFLYPHIGEGMLNELHQNLIRDGANVCAQ